MLNYKLRRKTIKRREEGRRGKEGFEKGREEKDKGGEGRKKIPLFRVCVVATFSPSNLLKGEKSLGFLRSQLKKYSQLAFSYEWLTDVSPSL